MDPQSFASLAAAIRANGHITDTDVRALRRAVWGSGQGMDRDTALAVLALHRAVPDRAPGWADFYVEALAEFFVDERSGEDIDDAAGAMLAREIAADGVVEDATELRLLLHLVFRARRCPRVLVTLARDALLASVRDSEAPFYGKGARRRGAVDADDVEAIRRLLYGRADGVLIDKDEALWLAGLDRATATAENVPAWRELYVKALAMYLLLGRGTDERLDAAGVNWIRQHLDGGHGLTPNGRALLDYLRREATAVDPSLLQLAA